MPRSTDVVTNRREQDLSRRRSAADRGAARWRLADDLAVESFGERAVVLLARRNRWITVNRAAAEVLGEMASGFGCCTFRAVDAARLLSVRYLLGKRRARREAEEILRRWVELGIIEPAARPCPAT